MKESDNSRIWSHMKEQEALRIVLAIANDWLETIDPGYAEEVLNIFVQGGQVQEALGIVEKLRCNAREEAPNAIND